MEDLYFEMNCRRRFDGGCMLLSLSGISWRNEPSVNKALRPLLKLGDMLKRSVCRHALLGAASIFKRWRAMSLIRHLGHADSVVTEILMA